MFALFFYSGLGILCLPLKQDTELGGALLFLVHIFLYPCVHLLLVIYQHLCYW